MQRDPPADASAGPENSYSHWTGTILGPNDTPYSGINLAVFQLTLRRCFLFGHQFSTRLSVSTSTNFIYYQSLSSKYLVKRSYQPRHSEVSLESCFDDYNSLVEYNLVIGGPESRRSDGSRYRRRIQRKSQEVRGNL